MKKYILPLAAGLALGLSGAAMAGSLNSDHGKVTAQPLSADQPHSAAVAKVSGPQLLTDSQMDRVVAGNLYLYNWGHRGDQTVGCVVNANAVVGFQGTTRGQGRVRGAYVDSCP